MTFIHALVLGLIQGVTEFFPISSSAHLKLAKMLLGISLDDKSPLFDLFCHFGTLMALSWFLREDITKLLTSERKKLRDYFFALLPLLPSYFLLKPLREYASHPQFLGIFLVCSGIILFLGKKIRVSFSKQNTLRDVIWIGTLQSAALIPGLSRSASTISCAQVLGWSAEKAVHFSFLLSIPTIFGGMSLELLHQFTSKSFVFSGTFFNCVVGFFAAFVSGSFVVRFAMKWLQKGHLAPFAWYCLLLGILTTILLNI